LVGTLVAPLAGVVEVTAGAVVSLLTPVVKLQIKACPIAMPARSEAAALTLAVYVVLGIKLRAGLKIAVRPYTLTPPLTIVPFGLNRIRDALNDAADIGWLKVTLSG
jgi:hypothetical protein